MKIKHILSLLLMVLAGVCAALTLWVVSHAMSAQPVVLDYPEDASACVESLMDSLCGGDFEAASRRIYGTPSLGGAPEAANPAAALIWAAFVDTLEYELLGEAYPLESGLAMDVKLRTLEVSSITEGMDQRAQAELNRRIEEAEDSSEIYDEKNDFRQELVEEVLCVAVEQALANNKRFQEHTLTLELVFDQGQWWVLPETELLNVLSGSISG